MSSNFLKKIFTRKKVQKEPDIADNRVIVIGGDYIAPASMLLDKKLSGDFYADKEVVVDVDAYITGNIVTNHGVIKGRVNGSVLCLRSVIIHNTAILEGQISAETVEIQSGARINGCITLRGGLQAPVLQQRVKQALELEKSQSLSSSLEEAVVKEDYPRKDESFPLPAVPPKSSAAPEISRISSDNTVDSGGWW